MNANRQFDEDDLVLYAMRLLAEPEHSEVAAYSAANPAAQQRLREILSTLAAYAEASVEPQSLPAGSLDRLLSRVEREPKTLGVDDSADAPATTSALGAAAPRPTLVSRSQSAATVEQAGEVRRTQPTETGPVRVISSPSLKWAAGLGWAIAALLAVVAGLTLQQRSSLRSVVNSKDTELAALSTDVKGLRQERNTLQSAVTSQEQRLANSTSQLAVTQTQAEALKNEAANARSTAASLSGQTSQLSARLNAEQARSAAAEQERARLQGTLAAQADQLAALQSTTSNAEVIATLTDPAALRVVLTTPKSKPAPVGRAAYVAGKGSLVFLANNLQPLQPNKVYELWLLPADGNNPVPAGTFVPDARGDAHVVYAHFPRSVPAKGFAITIENSGGATTPTMPLILVGS